MTLAALFFAVEVEAYQPGSTVLAWARGYGTAPCGCLDLLPVPAATTGHLYASDMGYRTASTDPDGVVAYAPLMSAGMQVNSQVNLDPSDSSLGAAWGTLTLANPDGQFDAIAAAWNADGRPLTLLYGTKIIENFAGPRTQRATTGTYIGPDGLMHSAAAGVVRWDYSSGVAVLLNELTTTNIQLNSQNGITGGSQGTNTVATSTDVPALFSGAVVKKHTRNPSGGADNNCGVNYLTAGPAGTYVSSIWVWVPSSSATTLVGVNGNTFSKADLTKRDQWQRIYIIHAGVGAGGGVNSFVMEVASPSDGAVVYSTCPQTELGTVPTTYFAAGSTIAERAPDNLYYARGITLDPAYGSLGTAFAGVATPWFLSDTDLQIPLRDATYWLEQPLQTALYGGTGSYDGTADLTGKPIPKTRGGTSGNPVCNVTPILVDPTNRIYQYNDAAGTVVNLYEGAALTITFASDTTNLYAGTTAAGTYRTDNSRGLFQLGSAPAHAITADVTGEFPTAGVQTTVMSIARYLLSEDAEVPTQYLDTASFTAADVAYPYTAGVYFDGANAISGVDAVDSVLIGLGAKLVPSRTGTLGVLVLRALPSTAAPALGLSLDNVVTLTPATLPTTLDPPPYRMQMGYSHNYTVQTSDINTATATAAQQQFVASADRFAGASSGAILTAYRRPNNPAAIPSALLKQADAQSVANDLLALWATRRRLYAAVVPVALVIASEIGDIVKIVFPMDDLAGGKLGQIVGYQFDSTVATTTVMVLV